MLENIVGRVVGACLRFGIACGPWLVASCIAASFSGPAQAVVYPDAVNTLLDQVIADFVDAPGFGQLDPAYFSSPEWNSLERFPFGDSPFYGNRDWGMSDAGKAIMAFEAFEPPLPHVRYRVSVRNVDGNAEYPNLARLVEVVRFNLGPALAASIRESYGDQFTPSAEEIGVGHHMAWRFALVTSQGLPNQIIALSRRFVSEDEAKRFDCLGNSCLALTDPGDEGWTWSGITVSEDGEVWPYRVRDNRRLSVPAKVADLLSGRTLFGEDLDMVISRDVVGQDSIANGVMWRADHQEWVRRWELAGMAARWSTASELSSTASSEPDTGYLYAIAVPTDAPAWQYVLLFETDGQPTRQYNVLTNGKGASYRSGELNIVGVSEIPAYAYGRIPDFDTALPIWPASNFPIDEPFLAIRVFDTGLREQMGRHVAHELRLVASLPHPADGTHHVWSGPIWAISDLPAAPGWQTLPGSPFAGRSQGLSMVWNAVGEELANWGMIARAEIALHTGVSRSDIEKLLVDDTDNTRLRMNAYASQSVRIRIGGLRPAPDGAFEHIFEGVQLLGTADWPGALPASTAPLLDQ